MINPSSVAERNVAFAFNDVTINVSFASTATVKRYSQTARFNVNFGLARQISSAGTYGPDVIEDALLAQLRIGHEPFADTIVDGVSDSGHLLQLVSEETSLGLLYQFCELRGGHLQVVDWESQVAVGVDLSVGLSDDLVLADVLEGDFVEHEQGSVADFGQGGHGLLKGRSILVRGMCLGVEQEDDSACSWTEVLTACFKDGEVGVVAVVGVSGVFGADDFLAQLLDVLGEDLAIDGSKVGLLSDAATSESDQRESYVISAFAGHTAVDFSQQVGELSFDGVDGFSLGHDDDNVDGALQRGLGPFGVEFADDAIGSGVIITRFNSSFY